MIHTHSDFPEFQLATCRLRAIRASDKPQIFQGLSDPRVTAHYGIAYDSLEHTELQMQWYAELLERRQGIWWGLCLAENDSLIGACGFNDWQHEHHQLSLGYWLLPAYWGRGLMQQALPTILGYALNHLQVHRIQAEIETENPASQRLLKNLGFSYEGTSRDVEFKDGRYLSLQHYSLLSSDAAAQHLRQYKPGTV